MYVVWLRSVDNETKSLLTFNTFCTFIFSNERKSSEKCQKGHESFVILLMKTPFEATFNKKPNHCEVWEWGEKWVRTEGGSKLGGHVQEGRWLGFNEKLNGIRVYWPEKQVVSVEQNVYFDKSNASVPRLEGEDKWQLTKAETVQAETVQSKQPKDHPIPEAAIPPSDCRG